MIQSQSFFIAGLEDVDQARASAFGAMILFIATFSASIFGICYDSKYKVEPVAKEDETAYYLSQGDVPTYGTSE